MWRSEFNLYSIQFKKVCIFVILRDVKKLVSIWVLLRSYYSPTLSKIPSVALAILPSVYMFMLREDFKA